jgi:hypothetical protein
VASVSFCKLLTCYTFFPLFSKKERKVEVVGWSSCDANWVLGGWLLAKFLLKLAMGKKRESKGWEGTEYLFISKMHISTRLSSSILDSSMGLLNGCNILWGKLSETNDK